MGLGDNIGNEAAALPRDLADGDTGGPALPWDNVRLGAEPPSTRAAGTSGLRPMLHDGPAALDTLSVIRVSSPRCSHALSVDASAIVTLGTGRLAFAAAAPVDLVDDVVRAFQLSSRDFDGRTVLTGTNGLAPSFAVLRCDECGQMHLTVVSYGEVQPDRFQLVFEGLAALDDLSAPIVLVADPRPEVAQPPDHAGAPPTVDLRGHDTIELDTRPLSAVATGEHPALDLTRPSDRDRARARSRRAQHDGSAPPGEHTPDGDLGARLGVIAVLVVAAIALVWVHLSTWAAWSRSGDLANTGQATTATVLGTESIDTGDGTTYSVTYTYRAIDTEGEATEETGQQNVDRDAFEAASEDRSIDVRYDRDDPTRSAVARSDDLTLRYVLVAVLDAAALLVAWRLWPRLRHLF